MDTLDSQPINFSFENWVGERTVDQPGSNVDSKSLPFQSWRPFKEAFAPEIVKRAVEETKGEIGHILDPFGGSGTSALTCKFLGINATTIEVNPFLADLIKAKLTEYDLSTLISSYGTIMGKSIKKSKNSSSFFSNLPPTFVEPGVKGRYLFSKSAAHQIWSLLCAIKSLDCEHARRLFSIILATSAVEKSNIVVAGKGRRYRKNWQTKISDDNAILNDFSQRALSAIEDIGQFSNISSSSSNVIHGDVRKSLHRIDDPVDICVFSPPYPNSFDYTDVYNVELWLLGHLTNSKENQALRRETLRSHVSIKRDMGYQKLKSRTLSRTLKALDAERPNLWHRNIPDMVGAYFHDMYDVFDGLQPIMRKGGRIYCVVGDSKYASIPVPVAKILTQITRPTSFELVHSEKFRSMKCSPQQGGKNELPETLLVFEKN